jgi:hypothetical protein
VFNGAIYAAGDYRLDNASAATSFQYWYDGTNVTIDSVGSAFQSQKYRIRVDYKL